VNALRVETEQFLRERSWRRKLMAARLIGVGVQARRCAGRKRAKQSPAEILDQPGRVLRRTFPTSVVRHRSAIRPS
jgi:hypothetical protein